MSRVIIIPSDGTVIVDGNPKFQPFDLSGCGIPSNVHALQWFDTRGWIEYSEDIDPFTPKPPNEEINELPIWADNCLVVWGEWTPPPVPEVVVPNNQQPISTGTQTL